MKKMAVRAEKDKSGIRILSPGVGYYSDPPRKGSHLMPGSTVGRLQVLNSLFELVLPDQVSGVVAIPEEGDYVMAVQYNQELLKLLPLNLKKETKGTKHQSEDAESIQEDQLSQGTVIRAFTTGIFYRKPSPDSPPYVEEGQTIEKGQVLGLIEVMKTFTQIVFQGTDQANQGKISKIFPPDNQEVKSGDPLFLISSF